MGKIDADSHCVGTMDEESDKLTRTTTGAAKNGEPIRRNHAEMPSRHVAVRLSVSITPDIHHSGMTGLTTSLFTLDSRSAVSSITGNGGMIVH
jgi:hypothetical protein